jgi:zinc/manganese transport system substrate-binding protein
LLGQHAQVPVHRSHAHLDARAAHGITDLLGAAEGGHRGHGRDDGGGLPSGADPHRARLRHPGTSWLAVPRHRRRCGSRRQGHCGNRPGGIPVIPLRRLIDNDYHNGIHFQLGAARRRFPTREYQVMRTRSGVLAAALPLAAAALLASACSSSSSSSTAAGGTSNAAASTATITAIGAENEYADVISQIGGKYVQAPAIMSNPNTDPHTFEASPAVAQEISAAKLIVQNGVGYDGWATTIENAAPNSGRKVINVQQLLGLPDGTPNPHLWYKPSTMPAVANAIAADLGQIDPAHASYYKANAASFIASLNAWNQAIAAFKAKYPNTPVATTEPVADYMLQAVGADNLTPFTFQADIMNGVDPSPQDVATEKSLFTEHKVKVLLYNQQVTDSLTQSFIDAARAAGIPVVGVYETMPMPGYDYQSWMLAEVNDLTKAVATKTSTEHL